MAVESLMQRSDVQGCSPRAFREEAAAWLTRLDSDPWQRPYPADRLLATIESGSVFMVMDGDVTAATITLTPDVEEPRTPG